MNKLLKILAAVVLAGLAGVVIIWAVSVFQIAASN